MPNHYNSEVYDNAMLSHEPKFVASRTMVS